MSHVWSPLLQGAEQEPLPARSITCGTTLDAFQADAFQDDTFQEATGGGPSFPVFGQTVSLAHPPALSITGPTAALPSFTTAAATKEVGVVVAGATVKALPSFTTTADTKEIGAIASASFAKTLATFTRSGPLAHALQIAGPPAALPNFTALPGTKEIGAVASASFAKTLELPTISTTIWHGRTIASVAQTLEAIGRTATLANLISGATVKTLPQITGTGQLANLEALTGGVMGTITQDADASHCDVTGPSVALPTFTQTVAVSHPRLLSFAKTLDSISATTAVSHCDVTGPTAALPNFGRTATAAALEKASFAKAIGAISRTSAMAHALQASFAKTLAPITQTVASKNVSAIAAAITLSRPTAQTTIWHGRLASSEKTLPNFTNAATAVAIETITGGVLPAITQRAVVQGPGLNVLCAIPAFTQAATSTVDVVIPAVSQSIGSLTTAATLYHRLFASASQSIAAQTLAAAVGTLVKTTAVKSLPSFQTSATLKAVVGASFDKVLGAFTRTGTVKAIAAASFSRILSPITLQAAATAYWEPREAEASQTLEAVATDAAANVEVAIANVQSFGAFGQTASATVEAKISADYELPTIETDGTVFHYMPLYISADVVIPQFSVDVSFDIPRILAAQVKASAPWIADIAARDKIDMTIGAREVLIAESHERDGV